MEELVNVGNLTFKLNKNDNTAEVLKPIDKPMKMDEDIFIPKSIKYQSQEYIITSLADSLACNCKIKSVVFDKESEVQTINYPFSYSDIETLILPPKIRRFKENWCCNTSKLVHISLSPTNEHFLYLDDKLLLGKSNENSPNYDVLIFARRDINKVVIPSFVRHITASAFSECKKLREIQFSQNSELLTIGPNAFAFVHIQTFYIPSHVIELRDNWCNHLPYLKTITISPENKNYKYLDKNRQIIVGKSDKKSDTFDILAIASRDTVEAIIPSTIKYISSSAFAYCNFFRRIEFEKDSKLISIGKSAFFRSSIIEIKVPKTVKYIGKAAFMDTELFEKVEFDRNADLLAIEVNLFTGSAIREVFIPSHVKFIGNFAFSSCSCLKSITIAPDSELQRIGDSAFSYTLINEVFIPKHVTFIGEFAFFKCTDLRRVEFEDQSELEFLGKICFAETNIESITIPSHVKVIKERTFMNIIEIKSVDFPEDSELTTICFNAFVESSVEHISLPSKVELLEDNWCNFTSQLVSIDLSPLNKNFSYLDEDHKIVVGKANNQSNLFDEIVFASRDIYEVIIPPFIKKINSCAFSDCQNFKGLTFSDDSELYRICEGAFSGCSLQYALLPKKLATIDDNAFILCSDLESVECLGVNVSLGFECFCNSTKLCIVSFPNASLITINQCPFIFVSDFFTFFIAPCASIRIVNKVEKKVDYGKGCQPINYC